MDLSEPYSENVSIYFIIFLNLSGLFVFMNERPAWVNLNLRLSENCIYFACFGLKYAKCDFLLFANHMLEITKIACEDIGE